MFLIDDPTAVGAMPTPASAGTPGWFSEGDPSLSLPATLITADWLNMMQAEFKGVLDAAGIVPDKTSTTQLAAAMSLLVGAGMRSAAGGGTANSITATFAPAVTGLANQTVIVRATGKNTISNPTFSPNGLTPKTIVKGNGQPLVAGDIQGAGHWIFLTGDSTLDKWVLGNPATQLTGLQLGATGFKVHATGEIEQWGFYSGGSSSPTIVYPMDFPTACDSIEFTAVGGGVGTDTTDHSVRMVNVKGTPGTHSFDAYCVDEYATPDVFDPSTVTQFYWRAWGR